MGLIARVTEAAGISTVCIVMNQEITRNVRPPRALYVRFPYGAPLGPAESQPTQMAVIREALELLAHATEPATLVESEIEWPE